MASPAAPPFPPPINPAQTMMGGQQPPQGPPGPSQQAAPPQPDPTWQVYPQTAPPAGGVYQIDPAVMDRPVRIKIEASSRMVGRPQLQQDFQALSQTILNPGLLPALAEDRMKVVWPEVLRMFNDATASGRQYRWIAAMTPEEVQAHQQPNTQQQQDMAKAQLDAQTRQQIMQMKIQSEQSIAQMDQRMQELQLQEEAARHILDLIVREKADIAGQPDPMQAQREFQMELAGKQVDLQHKQATNSMDLQRMAQEHQLGVQQQATDGRLQAHQQVQQMVLDSLKGRQQLAHQQALAEIKQRMAAKPKPTE